MTANFEYDPFHVTAKIPLPHTGYLDAIAKKKCFMDLWQVFRYSGKPMKELTESYSAYKHLSNYKHLNDVCVFHIGDGAHCNTGFLFTYLTKLTNVSIDPNINESFINTKLSDLKTERLHYFKQKIEDYLMDLRKSIEIHGFNSVASKDLILTFVHAHVDCYKTIKAFEDLGFNVIAVYTSGCCDPKMQLNIPNIPIIEDMGILSPKRSIQVYKKPLV